MKPAARFALFLYGTSLNLLAVFSPRYAAKKAIRLFSTPRKKTLITDGPEVKRARLTAISSNRHKIRCYQWNTGAAKKALLLHGFESAAGNFQHFVQPLIKKGYEVVAFDAQAHGFSGGTTITLPDFVNNIQSVFDRFGPFEAYLGHSFGGLALVHFCEKLSPGPVPKIVLIAPATETVSAIDRFFNSLGLANSIRKKFDWFVKQQTGKCAEELSISHLMPQIRCPVLWIHDRGDTITPFSDAAAVQNRAYTNVRFIATEGLGHRKIYRDEAVATEILAFI